MLPDPRDRVALIVTVTVPAAARLAVAADPAAYDLLAIAAEPAPLGSPGPTGDPVATAPLGG